jgi:ketosteroid isomerase-like protein
MQDPDVARVREGYEAFNRRDYDAIIPLLDPGIEYRMPMDPLRQYPTFRGHDGAREFYALLEREFDEFRADIESIHRLGDVISVTGRMTARPRGFGADEVQTFRFAHFWRVVGDRVVDVAFHDAENPFSMLESRRGGRAGGG